MLVDVIQTVFIALRAVGTDTKLGIGRGFVIETASGAGMKRRRGLHLASRGDSLVKRTPPTPAAQPFANRKLICSHRFRANDHFFVSRLHENEDGEDQGVAPTQRYRRKFADAGV